MTKASKIHNHNHVLFFQTMKSTGLHMRVSLRVCSSPMVEGTIEGLAGYFSVASSSKLIIVLPNFMITKTLN